MFGGREGGGLKSTEGSRRKKPDESTKTFKKREENYFPCSGIVSKEQERGN